MGVYLCPTDTSTHPFHRNHGYKVTVGKFYCQMTRFNDKQNSPVASPPIKRRLAYPDIRFTLIPIQVVVLLHRNIIIILVYRWPTFCSENDASFAPIAVTCPVTYTGQTNSWTGNVIRGRWMRDIE